MSIRKEDDKKTITLDGNYLMKALYKRTSSITERQQKGVITAQEARILIEKEMGKMLDEIMQDTMTLGKP